MAEEQVEDRNPSNALRDAAEHFREKQLPLWARDPLQQVSPRNLPNWTSVAFTLLPSFVTSYFRPNSTARPKRLHDTAYLDGLRGVAAFIVYLHHTQMQYNYESLYGYGSIAGADHILQLPFFKLLNAGPGAVALFFLISVGVLDSYYTTSQYCFQETDVDFLLGIRTKPQDLKTHLREPK